MIVESRRHFRVREHILVRWGIKDRTTSGNGSVLNVSISGALLKTDKAFVPSDNCELIIDSPEEQYGFFPRHGKVMWFKRLEDNPQGFLCGVKFNNFFGQGTQRLQQWVDEKVNAFALATDSKILSNYIL